jgi:hypothetical protein
MTPLPCQSQHIRQHEPLSFEEHSHQQPVVIVSHCLPSSRSASISALQILHKSKSSEHEDNNTTCTVSSSLSSNLSSPPQAPQKPSSDGEEDIDNFDSMASATPLTFSILNAVSYEADITVSDITIRSVATAGKRHVQFGEIEIRRYPMILGDNPSAQFGIPVSLGWEYEEIPIMTVDDYEACRVGKRRTKLVQLVLSFYRRQAIVERLCVDPSEIKKVTRACLKIQRQRQTTAMILPVDMASEMVRSVRRKVKKYTRRTYWAAKNGVLSRTR